MKIQVRQITAGETYAVRGPVLRAGLPPESAIFDGDEAAETRHFGAFADRELVGVVSIYPVPFAERPEQRKAWQLRGMGVVPQIQRSGVGEALLRRAIEAARAAGGELIWCNARSPAAPFYAKHGWQTIGSEFDIPTAGPHYRMWMAL